MRSDSTTMIPLLEGFLARPDTADVPFVTRPDPEGVEVDPLDLDAALAAPRADLFDVLHARRSTLRYAPAPVDPAVVLAAVRGALGRDRDERCEVHERIGGPEVFVLVVRSATTPAGTYHVTSDRCVRIGGPESVRDVEELGVQREFATAAGLLTVCVDLRNAERLSGAHGYRVAVTRAASVAYDVHLRLQAAGLAGTLYGGFIATAARQLLGVDGVSRQPVLSATFAPAAGDAQGPDR